MTDHEAQGSSRPGETEAEKLDRNTIELLNEIRVISTGIQVMFGFLLIVPFNAPACRLARLDRLTSLDSET